MTKYKVTLPNGSAEFFSLSDAITHKNNNNGLLIETIEEAEAPPPPDSRQTPMWSLRAVITLDGLETQVEQIIAALPQPAKTIATIAWNYGNFIAMDSVTVQIIKQGLNKTDAEVISFFDRSDALFI